VKVSPPNRASSSTPNATRYRPVSLALFVPLIAKTDRVDDVAGFLGKGYELVQAEPDTIQWFGAKYDDHTPPTFLILDTFRAEEGRGAHLTGKVAEALLANADALLAAGPEIAKAAVLANNVRDTSAGVKNGLRVLLDAKPEKAQAVREFLKVRCCPPNILGGR
jgi:quinol monooxygenase YgiN